MKYKFYTTSEKAWTAMLQDIREAKHCIYLESFILTDDSSTHIFFEVLKERARQGVRVKIIIDRVGDLWFGSINRKEFEEAGAEVLFFNRWLYRSHRKILIIDELVSYIGGVNVRGEYADWLDLHIRLTGRLVRSLLRSFSRVYSIAGGRDAVILNLRKRKLPKARAGLYKAKSWFIENWPVKGKSVLRYYYKKKCAEARKSITIVTPYFVPHRWLIRSLRAAASRGVKIEVIVPEKTDMFIANIAHRVFADSLKDILTTLFIPEMNHAKVLLIDDREGLVGSNNIDAQSFDFNLEASISFKRKDMVGDLRTILQHWKKSAVPFSPSAPMRWYYYFLGFFIRIIQPIL